MKRRPLHHPRWNPDTVNYDGLPSLTAEVAGKAWLFTLSPKGGATAGGTKARRLCRERWPDRYGRRAHLPHGRKLGCKLAGKIDRVLAPKAEQQSRRSGLFLLSARPSICCV